MVEVKVQKLERHMEVLWGAALFAWLPHNQMTPSYEFHLLIIEIKQQEEIAN